MYLKLIPARSQRQAAACARRKWPADAESHLRRLAEGWNRRDAEPFVRVRDGGAQSQLECGRKAQTGRFVGHAIAGRNRELAGMKPMGPPPRFCGKRQYTMSPRAGSGNSLAATEFCLAHGESSLRYIKKREIERPRQPCEVRSGNRALPLSLRCNARVRESYRPSQPGRTP
jgi:hypothetical protein